MPDRQAQIITSMFRNAPIGLALVNLEGRFLNVNEELCRMFGYPSDELMAMTFQRITHPEDLEKDLNLLRETLDRKRDRYEMHKRYIRSDGSILSARLSVSLIVDDQGKPDFFVSQIADLSEIELSQNQLLELQSRWEVAIQGSQDGLWDWFIPTQTAYFSARWKELIGYNDDELPNDIAVWSERIHEEDLPRVTAAYQAHIAGELPQYNVEYRMRHRNGTWRWMQLRGRVITRSNDGHALRLAGTQTDITDRIAMTQALERAQSDLQAILHNLPAMIGYWDTNLHNRFGNAAYHEWLGQDLLTLHGKHIREVIGEHLYQQNRDQIQGVLAGREQHFERMLTSPNGQVRYIQTSYIPDIQHTQVRGFFALATDVTRRKLAEFELTEQKELARVTLTSIGDGVITTDAQGNVTFLNPIAETMVGLTSARAITNPIEQVMRLYEEGTRQVLQNPLRLALREQRIVGMASNTQLQSHDGGNYSIEDSAAPIVGSDGTVLGAVIVFHDVSEARAMAIKMSHLAQHDALTDLPNRVLLQDRVEQAIRHHARRGNHFALLFIDLDHFKHVNDSLGHQIGDELLQQVAGRLRKVLRESDTVSRQGGDEFIVLLTELEVAGDAHLVLQKLIAEVREPYLVQDHVLNATFSIGVALYPEDGGTVDLLMQNADAAMYRAKKEGRNRFQFFSSEIRDAVLARQRLQVSLQHAIEQEQFKLHYQPQVDVITRQVVGVEALVRWHHEDGSVESPLTFIPLAEESRLIIPLGSWILQEACRQGQSWWQETGRRIPVAVNISPVQFSDPHFVEEVTRCLQLSGLPPSQLDLEITEGILMADSGSQQTIQCLQDLGVQISVDDFGTGYSGLGYLKRFNVNRLKIDRSFVEDVVSGVRDGAIAAAVISLGRGLNVEVVAEGVETLAQSDKLLKMGCSVMQGYFYARPMSGHDVLDWLEEWASTTLQK